MEATNLLTREEVKTMYKIGNSTFDSWLKDGLTFIRYGKRKKFTVNDIERYLQKKKERL